MSASATNLRDVQAVVDAVLYEGYILYPYRPTSAKNRQRWTFGGIYPQAWFEATGGSEPSHMQTQCLLEGDAATRLQVRVRFLHPLARQVGKLDRPLDAWPANGTPPFTPVASLSVGGIQYVSWQEAVEREVVVIDGPLSDVLERPEHVPFAFQGCHESSPIADQQDRIQGVMLRDQRDISGFVVLAAEAVGENAWRLNVRIENHTAIDAASIADRDQASLYSLASTHTIVTVRDGALASLMDPPPALREAAEACQNQGTYPVLVGEPGARDTLLSSPIILYDYPEIAPESPGDLYDATEIDEILSLRILTMTDAEKREMNATDPRAAALLARTEALNGDDFMRMHGTMREPEVSSAHPAWAVDVSAASELEPPTPRLAFYRDGDIELKVGDHVRLHPKAGGDAMDFLIDGLDAVIEGIERDFEDRVHVAVALDDDPGREWGLQRMPGHRFFFSPDEVESLETATGSSNSPQQASA